MTSPETIHPAISTGSDLPAGNELPVANDLPADDDIPALRAEIDHIDAEILRLVKRRSAISQCVGRARMAAGGPRIVYNREMAILDRFRDLGVEGRELGMVLLRLGRGRLGGR